MRPAAVLSIQVVANTHQAVRGLARMQAQLGATESSANKALGAVKTLAKGSALAAAGGLVFAVKKAADFEQQIDSLGAVSDATGRQMEQFRKQAMKAGADTKFSALDAAVAQTELAKGGLSVQRIMKGGLRSALALAAAGEMDLGDAAATTANTLKLFGLRGKDAMKVADALATAANATTADVSDFAIALRQGGAAARIAGLGMTGTVGILEALAEAGVKGSDAGTSLKAFFLNIATPSIKAANAMDELNVNIFDAQGNLKKLPALSENLRNAFGKLTKAQFLEKAGIIAGSDAIRTLYALYSAGPEKLRRLQGGLEKSGTAAQIAAKKQDNLKGKLENLQGSVETLAIAFGTKLLPSLTKAAEQITDVLNDKALSGAEKFDKLGQMLGDALAAAGPVVAKAAAKLAVIGTRAFFNAFRESPLWIKLLTAGFLISKMGGFTKSGAKAGAAFGAGFEAASTPFFGGGIPKGKKGTGPGRGGQLVYGKQFRSGMPVSQLGEQRRGLARIPQGIAVQAAKMAPAIRSIGKNVLGFALLAGVADAVTKQGIKGLGDRFQQGVSTATLGLIPAPHDMDERLAAITSKIRTWRQGVLKLSDASDPDNSLIRAKDLGDFTARQRQMLKGLAHLRNVATETFGADFKLTAKMELHPERVAKQLARIRFAFDEMSKGSVFSVRRLRDLTDRNVQDIAASMGLHSKRGQEALAENFRLGLRTIRNFKENGTLNVRTAGQEIARLMKVNSGHGKDALEKNMLAAQHTIARVMSKGGQITRAGTDLIRSLMVSAMQDMGLSPDTIRMSLNKKQSAKKGFTQPGQTGMMVTGGKPTGDSVHAILERGEVVINRRAVQRMGGPQAVNTINRAVPRFQVGGIAGMVGAANQLERASFPYKWGGGHQGSPAPFGPMDCSGAVSYVLQHGGIPIPTMTSGLLAGSGQPGPGAVTVFANPTHTFMRLGQRYFGTSGSNPGGGAGWMPDPGAGYRSRFTQRHFDAKGFSIPRLLVEGADSLVKTDVQGALDNTRHGANRRLRSVLFTPLGAGDAGDPGPGASTTTGRGRSRSHGFQRGGAVGVAAGAKGNLLAGLNKVFPATSLQNRGFALRPEQVRAVAEAWGGLTPPRAYQAMQISKGESAGYHPGIIGYDPGGTLGIGLWQITRGVQGALGKSWIDSRGGDTGMRNPKKNAEVMSLLSGHGTNWGNWRGTAYLGPLQPNIQSVFAGAGKGAPGKAKPAKPFNKPPFKGPLGKVLTKTLKVLRSSKSAKVRGGRLRQFEQRVRKGFDLPSKLTNELKFLSTVATNTGDYADKAGQLNVENEDGTTSLGVFRGKDEGGWLGDQLKALFAWRNKIVTAVQIVERKRKEVARLLERARERVRAVAETIRKAAKDHKAIVDQIEKLKKHPKRNKAQIETLTKAKNAIEAAQKPRVRERKLLSDRIIPALSGRGTALKDQYGTLLGADGLEQVQGPGGPLKHLKALPPLGVLGGSIFDVQLRLRDLAAPTTATDPAVGTDSPVTDTTSVELIKELLRQANLRTAVSEAQFNVLSGFKIPGVLGAFAKGGMAGASGAYLVGEYGPELAQLRTGTKVSSAADTQAMLAPNVVVRIHGDIVNTPAGMDPVEVVVNDRRFDAAVERATRRTSRNAGRGLPSKGGG